MRIMRKSLIAVGVAAALASQAALAETDAERIKRLEAMVEQQQKMLETLTEEVKQLRAGQQAGGSQNRVTANAAHTPGRYQHITLGSVISWRENLIPSRPRPEFLTPPNGMESSR